jgi:hypothetical protein
MIGGYKYSKKYLEKKVLEWKDRKVTLFFWISVSTKFSYEFIGVSSFHNSP